MLEYGWLPPEINSGRMYAGAGAGPLLAAAAAWDGLAAEMRSAAAGYGSVIAGLTSDGWTGAASTSMASAAAPYVTWMNTTATHAEQAALQARAAVTAYESAYAATVPPPLIAANRSQLATLVATNILGQNTPAIAATEAHYAEMWAQDATAMYGYAGASKTASTLNPFTTPPQTTNPNGTAGQAMAVGQAAAGSAGSQSQGTALQGLQSLLSTVHTPSASDVADGIKSAAGYATMIPQNGSYVFSLVNALTGLAKAFSSGGAAAAKAAGGLAPALGSALGSGAAGLSGLSGVGAVTAGLGQAGTLGALSIPQTWTAVTPAASGLAALGNGLGASPTATLAGAHGLMNGMPMLANSAARAAGAAGGQTPIIPRFDLRPSVIPMSPAAG